MKMKTPSFIVAGLSLAQFCLGTDVEFPSVDDVVEFGALCLDVEDMIGKSCSEADTILSSDVQCHIFEEAPIGTDYMVVSSDASKYVAVVFDGTNENDDNLMNLNAAYDKFGPSDNPIEPAARVHMGFNLAVFSDGIFDNILETVTGILEENSDYRVITTGHSLGAASSILTAVALAYHLPEKQIENYNFGCPMTGDSAWKEYVHEMENLDIWRFVHGNDLVARLPNFGYEHVGHTVQMEKDGTYAYYWHYGDEDLGYAGVPWSWDLAPLINFKDSMADHKTYQYMDYLQNEFSSSDQYIVSSFEE